MNDALASRAREAAEALEAPLPLPPKLMWHGSAAETIQEKMGISFATARKYLRAAIDLGLIVEIKPDEDWAFRLPGDEALEGFPIRVNRINGSVQTSWIVGRRNLAASNAWVLTTSQAAEVVRIYTQERAAVEAKAATP